MFSRLLPDPPEIEGRTECGARIRGKSGGAQTDSTGKTFQRGQYHIVTCRATLNRALRRWRRRNREVPQRVDIRECAHPALRIEPVLLNRVISRAEVHI